MGEGTIPHGTGLTKVCFVVHASEVGSNLIEMVNDRGKLSEETQS